MRVVRAVLLAPFFALAGVLLAPLLLAVARSWRGRAFALVGVVPWAAAGLLAAGLVQEAALFLVFFGLMAVFLANAFRPAYVSNFRGEFGPWYPAASAPRVACPESDLARLAVFLVTRLDPLMRRRHAKVIRRVTHDLLRDADASLLWKILPFGVPGMVRSLLTGTPAWGHYYTYRPAGATPAGVLVVLHGHGPNALLWVDAWRPFAHGCGLLVVAPSFGFGNWEHPAGVRAVDVCLADARERFPEFAGPVFLAGLSQGGCGVGRAAADLGGFAGMIFLSATMEPAVLHAAAARVSHAFVVQGGDDHNVRPRTVDAGVAALRDGGADVEYHVYPDADHFLFFAERAAVFAKLAAWVGTKTPRA